MIFSPKDKVVKLYKQLTNLSSQSTFLIHIIFYGVLYLGERVNIKNTIDFSKLINISLPFENQKWM